MSTILVIPARGGSKGIPRKSIRPVAGKPMIYYAIQAGLHSRNVDSVVVTTDDDEIALLSERFGATVIKRSEDLSGDKVTLDPVIVDAVEKAEKKLKTTFSHVITVQPTSPLVTNEDIEQARTIFDDTGVDTVLSVVDDRHLCWTLRNDSPVPTYTARVNRQELPANFRETGAVIACTRKQLEKGSRIGARVSLLEVPLERSFDIDSLSDLFLCESILTRRKIVFCVRGYPEIGLGHAYRCVMLAHELVRYEIEFVCEESSVLAANYIRRFNYAVHTCKDNRLTETAVDCNPDLVINDILDTKESEVIPFRDRDIPVVNFEDLGPGSYYADMVINALYPVSDQPNNYFSGPEYFCLRDEFLYVPNRLQKKEVESLLITFGGVDEGNVTLQCLSALSKRLNEFKCLKVDVVVGPGYQYKKQLDDYIKHNELNNVSYTDSTSRISDFMIKADMAITSGGRTVLELASLNIPTIVICQNQRELTHSFASESNGIINLGIRTELTDDVLVEAVESLLRDTEKRNILVERQAAMDLTKGKERVIKMLTNLIK
ncbi:CMP-N-acetylneuraminic acid synthetase [Pseudidiomarina planktonica]|uniref:CMP-N-acetylneuraminic acid synthetase n=1 Tax=Pseudidiomarina planktonica TaxID=1323738 RepID=A0A1Y6EGI9_9GAMM|nr:glycosyltransferase [Pseudidiomarina planktonica]RUO65932.1 UDP-2,4-diacetamido-2,4,6-trideoxy-beta-L-altropyranose hydrolase [Pseudidiomarina planktonica]SMQ61715.1 CMP-N-acetylneuraminic acid synthetase [Pseudidiomarina planktonica]